MEHEQKIATAPKSGFYYVTTVDGEEFLSYAFNFNWHFPDGFPVSAGVVSYEAAEGVDHNRKAQIIRNTRESIASRGRRLGAGNAKIVFTGPEFRKDGIRVMDWPIDLDTDLTAPPVFGAALSAPTPTRVEASGAEDAAVRPDEPMPLDMEIIDIAIEELEASNPSAALGVRLLREHFEHELLRAATPAPLASPAAVVAEWVPVGERLPAPALGYTEYSPWVWAYTEQGHQVEASYYYKADLKGWRGKLQNNLRVTHWRELPAAPVTPTGTKTDA